MARRCNFTFGDPDSYADAIEKAAVKLTITGAGDFSAQLVRLELKQLVIDAGNARDRLCDEIDR